MTDRPENKENEVRGEEKSGQYFDNDNTFWRLFAFFIGFFLNLFGFALYFIWKRTKPDRAYHTAAGALSGATALAAVLIVYAVAGLFGLFAG